jgi:hypothetical protein
MGPNIDEITKFVEIRRAFPGFDLGFPTLNQSVKSTLNNSFLILDTTPHRSGSHFPGSIVYLCGGHIVSSNFVLLAAIDCLDFSRQS